VELPFLAQKVQLYSFLPIESYGLSQTKVIGAVMRIETPRDYFYTNYPIKLRKKIHFLQFWMLFYKNRTFAGTI